LTVLPEKIHIVVDASRLPIGQAVYFDSGAGRMVFAIPREGKVYIGTTESEYKQEILNPRITKEERDYLLQSVNAIFSDTNLVPEDVESGWAGLRPLIKQEGKKPGEISRKDETFVYTSGLISIAGGKLTGYRKMAERIVNLVSEKLKKEYQLSFSDCVTDKTPISGGNTGGEENFDNYVTNKMKEVHLQGWNEAEIKRIIKRYGSNCDKIFALAATVSNSGSILSISRIAELEYAIQQEMIVSPLDFFVRRTAAAYFNIQSMSEEKEAVFKYMQNRLGWDETLSEKFKSELETEFNYLTSIKKL
jgi:glycerol-3-phosphate dehydrogenase